ncbi:MAG: very short patch repair endonuclease [Cyclobacteriaceae bacterium]
MTDVHDRMTRSFNMSQIKGKDTKPELLVRRYLFSRGFRYRLHDKGISGKPDIILPKYHSVIFVNGCFWHGHRGCKYFKIPKTRTKWWAKKIEATRIRDKRNKIILRQEGWRVITIFECKLKSRKYGQALKKLSRTIVNKPNHSKQNGRGCFQI